MKLDPGPPAVLLSVTVLTALMIGRVDLPWPLLVAGAMIAGFWAEHRWISLEPVTQ